MDLRRVLQELYAEKERLDRAIAGLEETRRPAASSVPPNIPQRRGRKSMNAEQRKEVSERMKRYWKNRLPD